MSVRKSGHERVKTLVRLFATFKHHQSDFQLKVNDKFANAKLVLKDSPPFYHPSQPAPITTNLKMLPALQRAYVFTFIIQ